MTGMARASGQCCSPAGTEPWHGHCKDGHCSVGTPVAVETEAPMAFEACGGWLQVFATLN